MGKCAIDHNEENKSQFNKNEYCIVCGDEYKENMDNKKNLYDKACGAIGAYLSECGWKIDMVNDPTLFYWIDPLTKMAHRSDLAWIIQTERDTFELYNRK